MRIVIIGGLGLIGSAFSQLAYKKGHEVIVLSRRIHDNHRDGPIQLKQWDGKNALKLKEIIEGSNVLVNLAGENIGKSVWTVEQKRVLIGSRLESAKAIVEACFSCKKPPQTLIQASAIGFYGTSAVKEFNESSPVGEDYLANLVYHWEQATQKIEEISIRRVVIRTGVVLDKNQGVLPKLMLPFKFFIGGKLGSGEQVYSWIHIEDEVNAILFLLENETCQGVFNLTAPYPRNNLDFCKILSKEMKRPNWLPVPGFALKLLLGEMSVLVLQGQKVLPKKLLELGFKFKYPELEKALFEILRRG